jgi:hypothetical protein
MDDAHFGSNSSIEQVMRQSYGGGQSDGNSKRKRDF